MLQFAFRPQETFDFRLSIISILLTDFGKLSMWTYTARIDVHPNVLVCKQ